MENNIINMIPQMLTIKETSQKAHLSEYTVRKLCKQGKIKFIKAGSKYLINFERFIDYLNGQE